MLELPHLVFVIALTGSFDGFCAVSDCIHHLVDTSDGGVHGVFLTELCCIGKTLTSCGFEVTSMGAVVFGRCGKILSID